jgi:hypothetical protein
MKSQTRARRPAGKANDLSDNLVRLVGNMMQTMQDELRKMNSKIDAKSGKESHGKDLLKAIGSPRVNEVKTWWYAVINSKDNTHAVFPDWIGGAAKYVMGVSGASVKKYNNYDQAWTQVAAHKQLPTTRHIQDPKQPCHTSSQAGLNGARLKEEVDGKPQSTRSESLP